MRSDLSIALLVYDETEYARKFAVAAHRSLSEIVSEILVIVTGEAARVLLVDPPPGTRTVDAIPSYPGRGRNVAVASARTRFICICDSSLHLDWHELHAWLEYMRRHARVGAGTTLHKFSHETYVQFCYFCWDAYWSRREARAGYMRVFFTDRRQFYELGGFAPNLRAGEDFDFYRRALQHGFTYSVVPVGRYSDYPRTLGAVFRKKMLYSSFRFYTHFGVLKRLVVMTCIGSIPCAVGIAISGTAGACVAAALAVCALPVLAITAGIFVGSIKSVLSPKAANFG